MLKWPSLTYRIHHAGFPGVSLDWNDILEAVEGHHAHSTGPYVQDVQDLFTRLQGKVHRV